MLEYSKTHKYKAYGTLRVYDWIPRDRRPRTHVYGIRLDRAATGITRVRVWYESRYRSSPA